MTPVDNDIRKRFQIKRDCATKALPVRANLDELGLLDCAKAVAAQHGVSLDLVLGGSRIASAAAARHRLWIDMRHSLAMSFQEIAMVFGVDHTTVMNAVHEREAELLAMYEPEAAE